MAPDKFLLPPPSPASRHERPTGARLHTELADRKVNQVNTRREFFYATPAEVRDILQRIAGQHLLEYRETPEAVGWRASRRTEIPRANNLEPDAQR
ncbi:hypothetical protein Raf01_41460 [Rugosimonospora africana]|uniref:Uncharacterized protein n=1 Tax=Rugosimonospora africana TaxID=556532 RepID=A0A8J3QT46_9ACTN|nr:hypothetical protein Raf01_41460 [Rugosimonospora africana]